jgi:hypothetical protein
LAFAASNLGAAEAAKAQLEKEGKMLLERYNAQTTPENGEKVNVNTANKATNTANIGTLTTALQSAVEEKDGSTTRLVKAQSDITTAEASITSALAQYGEKVGKLNTELKAFQKIINTEKDAKANRDELHRINMDTKDDEIAAANADPARQAELEDAKANLLSTYNKDNAASEAAIKSAVASRDGMKEQVAHVNGALAGHRGHSSADVKSCVGSAINNNVQYKGELDKANGAPRGCVRYHKDGASANDDEAYFLTSCDQNHYNCRQGGCNGCETI